ncbi:MAG TPA: class I SAM-dependent methyltransferase [Solirubrobacteraceae bacterium]|nr:class I SAM-dependent methyltransferase [Solirubrobacteraceae bacterium]
MLSAEQVESGYPSEGLAVQGANARTVAAFRESGALCYAELGVYAGDTALAIARELDGRGQIHLFDFDDKVAAAARRIEAAGYRNVVAHPNSRKLMDSYNWSLMTLLRESDAPRLDYVFLDGAHTWAVDALAFMLVDRLLRPGGLIEFDDYHWTIERSPSMNPSVFPASDRLHTREQMAERQVALVVDLLVRGGGRYEEIDADRRFRKLA